MVICILFFPNIGQCDNSDQITCEPLGDFVLLPDDPRLILHDLEADEYTRAPQARVDFNVNGSGLAAVVIDSGVNFHHRALKDRVIREQNGKLVGHDFTMSAGTSEELLDTYGHGSGVAGLIASRAVPQAGITAGIAPGARIIPIKVYRGSGNRHVPFADITKSLKWVLDNHHAILQRHEVRIGVVNLSLGFAQNARHIGELQRSEFNEAKDLIQSLREVGIVVVVASGNLFHDFRFQQGMDFPAICDPAISVGAVYDVSIDFTDKQFYGGECWVQRAVVNRIAPFSQRLAAALNFGTSTTIFAPGHNISSVCRWDSANPNFSKMGASANDGTSRAAPIVSGAVLLIQQRYLNSQVHLPSVSKVESALCDGGKVIRDDEETPAGSCDSVTSTGHEYHRLDVLTALAQVDRILYDEVSALNITAEGGNVNAEPSMPIIE